MVDDVAGVGKSLEALERFTREGRELIQRFASPPAEEVGQLIGDKISGLRLVNAIRVFQKARQLLIEQRLEPKAVHLKILIPILESGCLEDDESLVSKWAGLLASAATTIGIHISYPKILSEIAPLEAHVLDALYEWTRKYPFKLEDWRKRRFSVGRLITQLSSTENQIRLGLNNTRRLGLSADVTLD